MHPALAATLNNAAVNTEYNWIDADTIRGKDGKSYRLAGFDAPELTKVLGTGEVKAGTAGGAASLDIMRLAKDQGFTNVVVEDTQAAYGRGTARLTNDKGEDFATRLIKNGVVGLDKNSTDAQAQALEVARVFGDRVAKEGDEEFAKTAEQLMQAIYEDGQTDLQFKRAASNEMEYASDPSKYSANLDFRQTDRDIKGNALNPFSESTATALTGLVEAGYGFAALLGDATGIEQLETLGDQGSARARGRIAENAKLILDYKDVNSFGQGMEYITNNLAMSLPYMAITMGAAALAAPTGGASLLAPVSMYAGQVYNEQANDDKNWTTAVASGVMQGALDLVGLKLITKGIGNTPKAFFAQGVKQLMQQTPGLTRNMAEKKLASLTKRQVAGLALDGAKLAKDQIAKRRLFMDTAKAAISGSAGEGITEALQETIAYAGAKNFNGEAFDFGELNDRLINAAIAGGSLGGAFGATGAVIDKGAWADTAWKMSRADASGSSFAGKMYEEEVNRYGGEEFVPSTLDIAREAKTKASRPSFDQRGFDDWKGIHSKNQSSRTLGTSVLEGIMNVPQFFKKSASWIIPENLQSKSPAMRKLGGLIGANLQKIYSGPVFEHFKKHTATVYSNMIPEADKFYKLINNGKTAGLNKYEALGADVYKVLNNAVVKTKDGEKFDPSLVPEGPNRDSIISLGRDLQKMSDAMYQDQLAFNPELGRVENYLFKVKAFDKSMISKNKAEFQRKLTEIEGAKIDQHKAAEITEAILGNVDVNTIDEAFAVVDGDMIPGTHKSRTLGLSERADFDSFMDHDIIGNAIRAAKSAARYQAHQTFIGKDGEVLNQLLNEAISEGVPEADVARVGSLLADYVDAESGNYKRPETDTGKKAMQIQQNFIFLTTVSSLALATLSSLPELMITMKGLTFNDVFGKDGKSLRSQGQQLAKDLSKIIKDEKFDIDQYEVAKRRSTYGSEVAKDIGMYDFDVGAASKMGVTEIEARKVNALKYYFTLTGLTQYTDMTRAIRASFGADFILNNLGIILNHPEGKPLTNEVAEAKENLRNLGVDMKPSSLNVLNDLLARDQNTLTDQEQKFMKDMLRDPLFNFVNDAIANPMSYNRPMIYQDPRFALFTQFQGFMATFTANHIPKLWGEYVKRGSPAMKYNAFAVMTSMIMMGFVSQYLKDLLKYGQSTPYLETSEMIRRGVQSSGLLGTYERITSTISPIYDNRSSNEAEWLYNEISGQSPAISKAGQAVGFAKDVLDGNTEGVAKGASKLISLPSGLPNAISDSWDYLKGE